MTTQEALIRQLYVKINGNYLEAGVMDDLYRVEVENTLRLPSMCLLCLHDERANLTNGGPFELGASLEVGVSDERGRGETVIFDGEIVGLEPHFQEGTVVDLIVRAYDRSHRLYRGAQVKTYTNMSDSDIARDIANQVGLQADVDPSSTIHEHVFQNGQTHMDFLRERAQMIGYDVYVQGRTLCFKQGGDSPNTIELEWGANLRSFRPVLSLGEQVSQVQVRGWDPASKREVIGQAQRGGTSPQIGEQRGAETAEQAFGSATEMTVLARVASQSEADIIAQAILDEYEGAFVEAEGECYGVPEMKAGSLLNITALGPRFSGQYRATMVTHLWDTGHDYITRFTVRGRRDDTLQQLLLPHSGPSKYGWPVMTGIVTNNAHPDGLPYVKVKFPWLDGSMDSDWAPVVGIGAGGQRGVQWLPEVNDEVLVAFEQGDIARPYVIGGLWNGVDAPPISTNTAVSGGKVVQRTLTTRVGHKITFSEENPAFIEIETSGGHRLRLHDDDAKIEIASQGGATIVFDDNSRSITIKSGGQLEIEASQNLTIKAGASMNIEATGDLTIKGAIIQLNP